jgi:N-acetylmuramoyl-L-alanine amidase
MKARRLTNAAAVLPLIRDTDLGHRVAAVLAPARDRRVAGPFAVAGLALLVLSAALNVSRPVAAGEAGGMATLAGKKIALDAGHGGIDPGAVVGGLREADVNLAIVQRAKTLFEQAGAKVVLTRDGDEFLQLRQRAALSADQDLFLSVHVDATSRQQVRSHPATIRVYYFDAGDTAASEGAAKLASEMVAHAGTHDGAGDSGRQIATASFVVLNHAKSPAFMVNVGNMSSEEDRARLRDPAVLDALAKGLVEGAAAVLNSPIRP